MKPTRYSLRRIFAASDLPHRAVPLWKRVASICDECNVTMNSQWHVQPNEYGGFDLHMTWIGDWQEPPRG
jgi:hypothetical protein